MESFFKFIYYKSKERGENSKEHMANRKEIAKW